jgi:hypothetical protein
MDRSKMERRRMNHAAPFQTVPEPEKELTALSPLVPRPGQQFAVLMLTHLLPAFFDYAAQQITPLLVFFCKRAIIKAKGGFVHRFFAA